MFFLKTSVLFITIVATVFFCLLYDHMKGRTAANVVLLLCSVVCVFLFTLWNRNLLPVSQLELIPFKSYYQLLSVRWYGHGEYYCGAIIGNVLLFVPLGMLLSNLVYESKNFWIAILICCFVSLLIELTQCITLLGLFEIDDIINNTWGAMIGCSALIVLRRKSKSVKKNLKTLFPLWMFCVVLFSFCMVPVTKEIIRRL